MPIRVFSHQVVDISIYLNGAVRLWHMWSVESEQDHDRSVWGSLNFDSLVSEGCHTVDTNGKRRGVGEQTADACERIRTCESIENCDPDDLGCTHCERDSCNWRCASEFDSKLLD